MRTLFVPAMFYDDHQGRALDTPIALGRAGKRVKVALDDPALDDLLSDAEYYIDPYGPDMLPDGLRASATRTAKAIIKARSSASLNG